MNKSNIIPCGCSSSFVKNTTLEKMFADYKTNDIPCMEIAFGQYEDSVNLDFKEYKRLADKYGINLYSYHLPFAPFTTLNPADKDETVRSFTVNYFKALMSKAKNDADISLFIIHPSGEPIEDSERDTALNQAKKSLYELSVFAENNNMTLAVENLPRTCLGRSSDDMYELLSIHPALKMCFDINHAGCESSVDIIKRFADKIVTLHVSDYMGNDECHLLPLEGIVDWKGVINALKEANYSGAFLYEVSPGVFEDGAIWAKECWLTKLFPRESFLNLSDIKENFIKLNNL